MLSSLRRCSCLSCSAFFQHVFFSLHIALIVYFFSCSSLLQIWQDLLLHNWNHHHNKTTTVSLIQACFLPHYGTAEKSSLCLRAIKMLGRLVPLYLVIISSLPLYHSSFLRCQLWKPSVKYILQPWEVTPTRQSTTHLKISALFPCRVAWGEVRARNSVHGGNCE